MIRRRLRAFSGSSDPKKNSDLPIPPLPMRELVGPTDIESFDNPSGDLVYPYLPEDAYRAFFDFGCGCGRVARQLIQQRLRPEQYLGVDIHKGMIEWARQNLSPMASNFEFAHHDVYNLRFNPDAEDRWAPFPATDRSFSLVHALSVFTHLTEDQASYYLAEAARIVSADGYFLASWFLFDKTYFPMMPSDANALYVSYVDPSAAVIYDRTWVAASAEKLDLVISQIFPPRIRGHQWTLIMRSKASGAAPADWPADEAPIGKAVPPTGTFEAHRVT